jgi:hypothetical protein
MFCVRDLIDLSRNPKIHPTVILWQFMLLAENVNLSCGIEAQTLLNITEASRTSVATVSGPSAQRKKSKQRRYQSLIHDRLQTGCMTIA